LNNNLLQDKIQREAVQAWINSGKRSTCEIITGLGKTITSLHALYTMPKDDKVHIFLAEVTDRQKDLNNDIEKYNKLFNVNVLEDYNLIFSTYQSAYKYKDKQYGLVIADELPDSLSPQYSKFYYNNKYDAIIGLSATINRKTEYIINNKVVTKGDLLDEIAPVCFTYTVNQGQLDGTSRKLNIYIIKHELDNVTKNIKAGNKFKSFLQTEFQSYDYWDKQFKKNLFLQPKEDEDISKFEVIKNIKIQNASNRRKDLLYKLPSKVKVVKKLLNNIKGKTILFGNSIDSLLDITPNTVSSRKSKEQNEAIREAFDNNKINTIASFKKLEQGANLKELDNVILHSYYSIEGKIIQRAGRNRMNGDKVGNLFILCTVNSQEEIWLSKAIQNFTEYNIINCENVDDCIKQYKLNETN